MMSSGLYLHVLEGLTVDDLAAFSSNIIGSRWFVEPQPDEPPMYRVVNDELVMSPRAKARQAATELVIQTPHVYIGEVWKLRGDKGFEAYPTGIVHALVTYLHGGEMLPEITPKRIEAILSAMDLPPRPGYGVNDKALVAEFLAQHVGKQLFCVIW